MIRRTDGAPPPLLLLPLTGSGRTLVAAVLDGEIDELRTPDGRAVLRPSRLPGTDVDYVFGVVPDADAGRRILAFSGSGEPLLYRLVEGRRETRRGR